MLALLAALIGALIGMGIAFQTGMNSVLRNNVVSPLLSSFISFGVGSLFLILLILIQNAPIGFPVEKVIQSPWWIWLGGLLAMFGLTVNILIFPRLGSVQTAIMPILGQVITGTLVDTFGWFSAPQYDFSALRLAGLMAVMTGIGIAIILPSLKQPSPKKSGQPSLIFWQILGISGGIASGITPAVNTALRQTLQSIPLSVFVPFIIGTLLLALMICFKEPASWKYLKMAIKKPQPWWQWFGGLFGAVYIGGIVIIVPQIGTGGAIVTSLFGLLVGSLIIDQFGLLGAKKKPISLIQILGLFVLLVGW
ncbi:orotate transporter [Rodentibacter trehalosifermentans]|uniref:Orotate transporter n=1 Tax=Rodentibacter trehalosifermentans TaxID=1908263 RepID=A0A1V3IZB8_9PAST|nr:DMT family transporter [Rodentibacter trehalosifermentans]OOF47428.1 orotate transporter [Rodentibacter trehalosifermentans]